MLLDITARQPSAPSTPSLFTNHGLVLLFIASQPGARERDIAAVVGITERSAQRIVGDLVSSGFIARRRSGRRNVYEVQLDTPLSDPVWTGLRVRDLLDLVAASQQERRPA
jgi:DNA-binding MarR family transcriptional regulator